MASSEKNRFDPNKMTLDEGLALIRNVQGDYGISTRKGILTSRDEQMRKIRKELRIKNVPEGFNKWMLPFNTDGPATFYMSFAAPNSYVPEHTHDEGDGIRFMLNGSIQLEDLELSAGDWMYIPKGAEYSFKAGPMGAGMFYCYQCCCG